MGAPAPAVNKETWAEHCQLYIFYRIFRMAPLIRSMFYELPELPLEASNVESKNIQVSSYPIKLFDSELPRLVTYKNKTGTCTSCSQTSKQACAECRGLVFYCGSACQRAHWPIHKDMCHDLKDHHLAEEILARDTKALNQITEDLGNIISSEFRCLNYRQDPKLAVKINDSASFGDFYDVMENSECTIRDFHPGIYKCTLVTPDDSFTPVTIYHHESVDPSKIVKQCVLISKDVFEHSNIPNQITMPDWCNWLTVDEEYIPSDSDSETDSDISETELLFADFVGKVLEGTSDMKSDSEDQEYDPSDSDSEDFTSDSDVSDHEIDYLISENKQYIKDIPQKRQSIAFTPDMEVAEEAIEDSEDSEAEAYKDFKKNVSEHEHKYDSDTDSDYLPYSESDSDSGDSIPERNISDSERFISDNEVEEMLEASRDIRDLDEEMYSEFVDNVFDKDYIEESDLEDTNYIQSEIDQSTSYEEISDSEDEEISNSEEKALLTESREFIKNISGKRQSIQTSFYSSDSDSYSEVSSEEELYEDFKIHTEANQNMPDEEDAEYIPEHSESESSYSDEMEISDAESDAIFIDSKDDLKQISGKRESRPTEDDSEDSNDEVEMASDDELYSQFRSKLIVSDPSKGYLEESDDDDFIPPAGSQDLDESQESQDDSQAESEDEGSQASNKSDEEMDVSDNELNELELSSEDELYEDFKDNVCKTQRKMVAHINPKFKNPMENSELIYFMQSKYSSSLKEILDCGKIEKGSYTDGSFVLKSGSETSGIAVNMKGQNWRSAHIFEDSNSGKCFAVVVFTDTWEHLSNNYEHLKAHYPDLKWSSVAESELKFQMNDFVC